MKRVIAFGPASIANVGPFFDAMGYCLGHLGDFVEAKEVSGKPGICLTNIEGPYSSELSQLTTQNCVDVIAEAMWAEFEEHFDLRIELTLHKYMPVKSGLGSSAASCVATTRALLSLLEGKVSPDDTQINNIMMQGEREVSGHYYPDNVVPSYFQ